MERRPDNVATMLRDWLIRWRSRHRPQDAVGALGEAAAARELQRRGLSIVTRNWRHKRDEIDLVCLDGDVLVFVEVKTRAAHALVGGLGAVDKRKKSALRRAGRAYLAQLRQPPRTVRFDVVEVDHRDGRAVAVRHFENLGLFGRGFHCDR